RYPRPPPRRRRLCTSSSLPSPLDRRPLAPFPTRRSSDLVLEDLHGRGHRADLVAASRMRDRHGLVALGEDTVPVPHTGRRDEIRSEEHTSELQSRRELVCRLLLEKKKQQ